MNQHDRYILDLKTTFAGILSNERRARGMTQESFADMCLLNQQDISSLEHGKISERFSLDRLIRAVLACNLSVEITVR